MSDQQIVKRDENSLAVLIDRPEYKNRFQDVLGHRAAQFMSSLLSLSRDAMKDVEPKSILAAAMTAASLDLPINPNLGFAYIIAYKDRSGIKYAQFQIGYKGFVQMAMRTGKYRFMNTCRVFEGELIKYNKLTGELIIDEDKKKSENVVGYASYFKLVNGFEHSIYMTIDQVTAHGKQYSQTFKKSFGQWVDNFDAMALKTVLKLNLSKWGILTVEMEKAIYEDQGVKHEIDAETVYPDNTSPLPGPQIEDTKPAAATEVQAEVVTSAPEKTTTEKPAAAEKDKSKPKKKGGLKLVPHADADETEGAAQEKPAEPQNSRQLSPLEIEISKRLNDAGFLRTDLLSLAVKHRWLDAPEGYDGDVADLEGMAIPDDKAEEFLDKDNWELIVDQIRLEKKKE